MQLCYYPSGNRRSRLIVVDLLKGPGKCSAQRRLSLRGNVTRPGAISGTFVYRWWHIGVVSRRLGLRGAEAPLFHVTAGFRSSQRQGKNNVKSSGQECPLHTCNVATLRSKPTLQAFVVPTFRKKRERWGTPLWFLRIRLDPRRS